MNSTYHRLLIAAFAQAAIFSATNNVAQSQQSEFHLTVRPDASVWLKNTSADSKSVAGYYITTVISVASVSEWNSLENQLGSDPVGFREVFGQHIRDASIFAGTVTAPDGVISLTESILGPPLAWPAGLEWPIGTPLGTDVSAIRDAVARGEITWFADYCEGCAHDFPIIFEIPEPATIVLLLCGLPGAFRLVRLRRRGTFQVE